VTTRLSSLLYAAAALAVSGCTNTVIIYDYSTRGGKVPADTVFVEKPSEGAPLPPGTHPVPGGSAPVLPDSTPPEAVIPGRWSSVQPLSPGTARLETVVSTIDSLVIYRVIGNSILGRASAIPEERSREMDLNPEVWKDIATGEKELFLTLVFTSHSSWVDVQGSPEVLFLEAGGETFARFTLGLAEDVLPVQLPNGSYSVSMRFPTTQDVLATLARTENVTASIIENGQRSRNVFSADNTQNFLTFFEVYVLGEGTKDMSPEEGAALVVTRR
jgi:hypothetical protein